MQMETVKFTKSLDLTTSRELERDSSKVLKRHLLIAHQSAINKMRLIYMVSANKVPKATTTNLSPGFLT